MGFPAATWISWPQRWVCGTGVGAKKTDDAEKKGVAVWTEDDFVTALDGGGGGGSGAKREAPAAANAKPAKHAKKPAATAPAASPAAAPLAAATASNIGTVNPVSGLESKGHVFNDGDLHDIDLASSDTAANSNKFYRLQLVESSNSKKYWMVQHWGRIGTGGQNQVKEFADKVTALKEFNKKFKSKVREPPFHPPHYPPDF